MAAQRIQYQIVGRYMDGTEVTGYHMQSLESNKSARMTKEQLVITGDIAGICVHKGRQ